MALGDSLVDPKLALGWSIASTAGRSIAVMMFLAASWQIHGTSTLMTGPVVELKNLGFQAVILGVTCDLGVPSVNNARHLWAWIGATVPETTMRDGGVSKLASIKTSRHLSWRRG